MNINYFWSNSSKVDDDLSNIKYEDIIQLSIYEQFIEALQNLGLRHEHSFLKENDDNVIISEDDETIFIKPVDCKSISIKGSRESIAKGRGMVGDPHRICLKIYDYENKEIQPTDTIQFGIIESYRDGHELSSLDKIVKTIQFRYPYKLGSEGRIYLKRGVMLTKNKMLEIKVTRLSEPLKMWKIRLSLECDKWYENNFED